MGAAVLGADKGDSRCPDLGEDLCGGGSGGHDLRVGDEVDDSAHWEGFESIPPQGGLQADGGGGGAQRERYSGWVYPPLEEAMIEAGFQEVDTYLSCR